MNDLDQDIAEHYEQLELSPDTLAELQRMEREADRPVRARRQWAPLALAAAALLGFVGISGAVLGGALDRSFSSIAASPDGERTPRKRLSIQEYNALVGEDGSQTVINGEKTAPVESRRPEGRPERIARSGRYKRKTIAEYNASRAGDGALVIIKGHERNMRGERGERPHDDVLMSIKGDERVDAVVRDRTVSTAARPQPPVDRTVPPVVPPLPAGQPWVDTRLDPVSTFAADVDTASYTRARANLQNGSWPARSTLRAEEFVNAQHYDYRAPDDGVFGVSVEGAPSVFDPDKTLVRIGVQAKRVPPHLRKPVHLTFLVDVSGSMGGHLELVRSGLAMLVRELRATDTVAIVTYAGSSEVLLRPTSGEDKTTILSALDRLVSGGSTAMGSGIELAYELARSTLKEGHENRVLIASDGDANVGASSPTALVAMLRTAADQGITLTTLSVGGSANGDQVMETLANKGDGQSFALTNRRDAERVLVHGLTGTLQTLARDVKLQVAFDPSIVRRWRQVGYDNRQIADRDFRDDAVDAGEIGAGHQMTALYEVEWVTKPAAEATVHLGELRLRYQAPGAESGEAMERALPLEGPIHPLLTTASTNTRVAVVAAGFAAALRGQATPTLPLLEDVLPIRPEYREADKELLSAIQNARRLKAAGARRPE